jgi:hypothetical protein
MSSPNFWSGGKIATKVQKYEKLGTVVSSWSSTLPHGADAENDG